MSSEEEDRAEYQRGLSGEAPGLFTATPEHIRGYNYYKTWIETPQSTDDKPADLPRSPDPIMDYGSPRANNIATAVIVGPIAVGVACYFSETARNVVGKTFGAIGSAVYYIGPTVDSAVDKSIKATGTAVNVASNCIYNIGYYGYETVATAVNNIDLIAAGGVTAVATTIAAFVLDEKYAILDKKRKMISAFLVGGIATTSAVYATATQVRKLGYQSVVPQWTEIGSAISEWGRTRPTPAPAMSSATPRAAGTTMAIVPTPAHYTVDDLLNMTRSLRAGGYVLSPEQIKQLESEGVTVKGQGPNTTVTVKPDYFPEPRTPLPPHTQTPYQKWQQLYKNLP